MARSNPNQNDLPKNPSKMFAQWTGDGQFVYYDKETQENVVLPDNFTFLVLDELNAIKGWNDESGSGIYSNEVRHIDKDKLRVKSFKGGLIAEGIYKDIHDSIVSAGGKYCKSVYIAFKFKGGELQIGNIQFYGASIGGYIEFCKENKKEIYSKAVILSGKRAEKKGKTEYYVPLFKLGEISQETEDQAGELQIELKKYLEEYFNATGVPMSQIEQVEKEISEAAKQVGQMDKHFKNEPEPNDNLPF